MDYWIKDSPKDWDLINALQEYDNVDTADNDLNTILNIMVIDLERLVTRQATLEKQANQHITKLKLLLSMECVLKANERQNPQPSNAAQTVKHVHGNMNVEGDVKAGQLNVGPVKQPSFSSEEDDQEDYPYGAASPFFNTIKGKRLYSEVNFDDLNDDRDNTVSENGDSVRQRNHDSHDSDSNEALDKTARPTASKQQGDRPKIQKLDVEAMQARMAVANGSTSPPSGHSVPIQLVEEYHQALLDQSKNKYLHTLPGAFDFINLKAMDSHASKMDENQAGILTLPGKTVREALR
ncbi:hypothetical protein DM01DRAFT_1385077, partial [Hesseltinella vesiculosa]